MIGRGSIENFGGKSITANYILKFIIDVVAYEF